MGDRFPSRAGRQTIVDVARASGVSKATVSKALSPPGRYYVSDSTRQKVQEAVRHLDFQPSTVARNLSSRRTWTLGVVVPSLTNPFYPDLVAGVEAAAGPAGYTLLLGTTRGDPAVEDSVVRTMSSREVDGVVMAGARMDAAAVEAVRSSGLPVVLASRDLPGADIDTVIVDNYEGARLAVEHLIGHGHSSVAHIGGPPDVAPFVERARGWANTCGEHGLRTHPDLLLRTGTQADAGAAAARHLLAGRKPPSAIFVGNDLLALGALQACVADGVRVPQDLALVAFDDVWVGTVSAVPLSTVDSRAEEIGRAAAELLMESMRPEGRGAPARRLVLRPRLVVRQTCGCPQQTHVPTTEAAPRAAGGGLPE